MNEPALHFKLEIIFVIHSAYTRNNERKFSSRLVYAYIVRAYRLSLFLIHFILVVFIYCLVPGCQHSGSTHKRMNKLLHAF